MQLKFGNPKSLDDITLEDAQEHPIWLWVWEAGLEEVSEDETWQCPVVNSKDVDESMTEPVITLLVKNTNLVGSASYSSEKEELDGIAIWQNDAWVMVQEADLSFPVTFVSVPTIQGVKNVEFICSSANEPAKRHG